MADLDYGDRPSKDVTRRMLIDVLGRLGAFQKLSKYSYVGFGAIQFVDFDLVHRGLGINKMISIEGDSNLIARCNFNAPFKGIKVLEGTSTTVLPSLDWSAPAIVWLDYTQKLRTAEMSDVENLMLVLQPGSVLVVTLNSQPNQEVDNRRNDLANAVGEDRVPLGLSDERLGGWGLANVQREIFTNHVVQTLAARADSSTWQQLLNIHYKDGASMQMIAGILDHPSIHSKIAACRLQEINVVRDGPDSVLVKVPLLTKREKMILSKTLPGKPSKAMAGISLEKLEAYAEMYRWMDPAV